jgi:hypothetical protein
MVNNGRFALMLNMFANHGRKIGMQATTNPKFLSSLISQSARHVHRCLEDWRTYTDHNP